MRLRIRALVIFVGIYSGLLTASSFAANCVDDLKVEQGAIGKIVGCLKEVDSENRKLQSRISELEKLIPQRGNDVIYVGRVTNGTVQFMMPPNTNASVLAFSSTLQRDGQHTDTISLNVVSTNNATNAVAGNSTRTVIKTGSSGHYWGYSTLLPIVADISNPREVPETFQATLSGDVSAGADHVILVFRK